MSDSSIQRPLTFGAVDEVLDAQVVQVEALEGQQREEQPALAPGDERHDPRRLRGILFGEADRVDLDVGVFADAVRVAVVAGVLGVPPGAAGSDDAVAQDACEPIAGRAGAEDLAVPGLMREERHLGEHDAERCGDEQLEPAVTEQDEAGDAAAEGEQQCGAHEGVEPGRSAEEPGLADDLGHLRVRAGQVRKESAPA